MLDISHKIVCYNGYGNLNTNGILCVTPESLDFEMKFRPFENRPDLSK